MHLKNFTLKKSFISAIILSLGAIFFIDIWPSPLRQFWVRFPKLDKLRILTKPLDIFYLPFFLPSSNIPHYQLIVDPNDYQKMLTSLPQAHSFTIYDQDQQIFVPAIVKANQNSYQTQIRFHGDLYHHWSSVKKSLRLKFKDQGPNNYQEITLILPQTREFFVESLASHRAQKLGLVMPDTWFATLSLNDQPQGIYFVQEHWSKDFLERHGLSSDSDLFGELDLQNTWDWPQLFQTPTAWKKYSQNPIAPNDYSSIQALINVLKEQDKELQFKKITSLIDINSFANWQAHAMLIPSYHQDSGHNMRLYFNRDLGQFQFIPYDLEPSTPTADIDAKDYNHLVTVLLSHPQIKSQRDQILKDYVKDQTNLKDDLKFYDSLFLSLRTHFAKDTAKPYSTLFFTSRYLEYRHNLIKQYKIIQKKFL